MKQKEITKTLQEKFGDPIGSYAGDAPVGVRDEDGEICEKCGMMSVEGKCGCVEESDDAKPCEECGMLEVEGSCGCKHMDEEEKKGPSKKTAQKILRGTKTFKQKMKKVEKWADDPAAAAAWMTHKATGKWPSEK